jgi:hypothetical protein
MRIILDFIARLIAFGTFNLYSFKTRIFEFLKIRLLNRHKQFRVHKVGNLSDSRNIAVVALYPRKAILNSALRLIDQLVANGFQVVTVVNFQRNYTNEWLQELAKRNLTILVRPNIGRDFGAYQAGIKYVQSMPSFESFKRMVIANDSVYYFPESKVFIDELLGESKKWYGMFVNYQFHVHAQSFFESFTSEIFLHRNFISFWKKYFPTDIRHNVIKKGEVGLTANLVKAGFSPGSYVSPRLIETASKFRNFQVEDKFALWSGFGFSDIDRSDRSEESHSLKLKIIFATQNPTHHAGLIATRTLGAPLKLDLFRTGLASLEDILTVATLAGLSGDELREFEDEISSKGSYSSYVGLKKLWLRFGYQ